jgi:hypothetical protein
MKLYRQTIRDDWNSVFDQVAADLANLKADTEPEGATAGGATRPIGSLR